jgi:hypothetical protein
MQQAYPTNVVAHIELLTSVQFLHDHKFLVDIQASRRLGASAPWGNPIIATNSSANSSQHRVTVKGSV